MMLPLRSPSWHGLCISIKSARVSSAWMPPIGGYASSPGFMPPWARSQLSPGTPNARKIAPACPPFWTKEELGKRSAIERFFGRVFLFFHLQRPPLAGWSTMVRQVALTYTATIIVALAAQQAGRPDLIRSPKRVLAHTWEGFEL